MNEERLNAFLGKAVGDLGAAVSAVLISIGDSLGYYRVLSSGPMTPAMLAEKMGTNERYAREWLGNQAAGGYVDYEPSTQRYLLNDEQRAVLLIPVDRLIRPGRMKSCAIYFTCAIGHWRTFARVGGWNGASTTRACSMEPSAFSAPVTT